jgi:2-oxoisovalerate dehydrogenase E1 component beta subunit
MGEDVGKLGGVFRITDGLQKDFGEDRVIDTPLAESGIVGTAVGLAMRGYRPVCEIQFDGFVFPAYDQIVSQVAKMHYRSQGKVKLPIVIRIPFGGGIGAVEHHSESPEALLRAHRRPQGRRLLQPGRRVLDDPAGDRVSDDPVIFFEPKRRYWEKAEVDSTRRPPYPLHASRVVREGTDVTLLAYGPMVKTAPEAAEAAPPRRAVARGHRPAHAVAARPGPGLRVGPRTGRCVVVHEAPVNLGSAPRSPPGSPRSASTPWRRRCCGSAASTRRTRRRGSRRSTCPTSTGCSTPSTARSATEPMSRIKEFKMPDVGEGLTEAEILTWLVKAGRHGRAQPDRSSRSRPRRPRSSCPPVGRRGHPLIFHEGETVEVGTPIIAIDTDPAAPEAAAAPEPGAEAPAAVEIAEPEGRQADLVGPACPPPPAPPAAAAGLVGYGPAAGRRPRPRPPARPRGPGPAPRRPPRRSWPPPAPEPGPESPPRRGRVPLAKPPVRKLAKDLGVDLTGAHRHRPGGIDHPRGRHAAAEPPAAAARRPPPRSRRAGARVPVKGVRR